MPYIFEDLKELLNNRSVTPDLGYFDEALNYTPPDNKPWQSAIEALETEWHPWNWVRHNIPERMEGEPERAKDDNPGFQEKKEMKKAFRIISMASPTVALMAERLSSSFPKTALSENKDLLSEVLEHRGIEGHVYMDPELFGSCLKAKEFAAKQGFDPAFVLKRQANCMCGGNCQCLVFGKPTVPVNGKIPVTAEMIYNSLKKAVIANRLTENDAKEILGSKIPAMDKLKRANLSYSKKETPVMSRASGHTTPVDIGINQESKNTSKDASLLEKATKAVLNGNSLFSVHSVIASRYGTQTAHNTVGQIIQKTGKIRVSDLDDKCTVPKYFGTDFKLEQGKRCVTCSHFRYEFCKKLGKRFTAAGLAFDPNPVCVCEHSFGAHKFENMQRTCTKCDCQKFNNKDPRSIGHEPVQVDESQTHKGAREFQEVFGGNEYQMPVKSLVLEDSHFPAPQTEASPANQFLPSSHVDLSLFFDPEE